MRSVAQRAKPLSSSAPEQSTASHDGVPLPRETRTFFEPRFGHDFSQVRVHATDEAASSALAFQARAYTTGNDITFGANEYRPDTVRGHRLLAHELAHVVQQRLSPARPGTMSERGDAGEKAADGAANVATWGGLASSYGNVARATEWSSQARAPAPAVAFSAVDAAEIQRVELTYDDGPDSAGNTRTVLTALDAAGAKATFYLVGKRVAQGTNWKVVFDIAASGHWLGNHAYDWNDTTDNHIFLNGSKAERAQKILNTEWSIRDALIQGRDDAVANGKWATIPQANRDYIDDVIAHGTGRFRTPGFRSKIWTSDGTRTLAALYEVNEVLAATGLRPLAITKVNPWYTPEHEGVSVDPEDWRAGKTQADVESSVKSGMTSNSDSILLHSRLSASAAATPAIAADIKERSYTFDPTVQGQLGSVSPGTGFFKMSFSNPPTAPEVAAARAEFMKTYLTWGPVVAGHMAIGIFQLAQRVSNAEVMAFAAQIKATIVKTPKDGDIPLANWMQANEQWQLFTGFFENWALKKPFPKVKGVTI